MISDFSCGGRIFRITFNYETRQSLNHPRIRYHGTVYVVGISVSRGSRAKERSLVIHLNVLDV